MNSTYFNHALCERSMKTSINRVFLTLISLVKEVKINSLRPNVISFSKIKKNDGLPQIVCMRCLGTLEFLCDFYDSCNDTQRKLVEAVQNGDEDKLQRENDAESDKENAVPSTKHKPKALSPGGSVKSSVTKTNDSNNVHGDNDDCTNGLATCTLVPLKSLISNEQSAVLNIFSREKNPMNEQKHRTNFTPKDSTIKKTDSMNLLRTDETNVNESSVFPVRRKRGRKSKFEKMREASLLKKENNDSDSKCKKYGLRKVCKTVSTVTKSDEVPLKAQAEQVTVKKQVVIDSPLNETVIKNKSADKDTDKQPEMILNDESSKKTEDNLMKSKAISVIVKQEKLEPESASSRQNEILSPLTWIPNTILRQENLMDDKSEYQTEQQKTELLEVSPLRKKLKTIENIEYDTTKYPTSSDDSNLNLKVFKDQNRVTVIKSFPENEVTATKAIENELYVKTDATNRNTESDLESSLSEQLLLRYNQSSSCDESKEHRKNKEKLLTKISHLISDEEKQAIEGYYTVNMSIVNHEEVQKNLTIIDKKNIRCNICGFHYLRIDKCQVHIWGHLQMKPYQCKACDFSTVTVTNIRGHIRKSHLKLKPFSCDICLKRYATAFLLDEHMNTHTGDRPFKCKLCDFSTSRSQLLSYHIATHQVLKEINCKICGREFSSKSRLRAHMLVHNKDKIVVCKLCSAYLSNQESLEAHYKNVHMQDYICKICGKRLKSKKALHNHKNVHAVGKYKCSLCPNVYKSSQILKEHLLKHKGIRNYKCNVCEKTFAQQSHLAAHMAVHSNIRFHCPGCDRPFNRHDNMKIHTKRCKMVLANPDLKNFLVKRERSSSFTKISEVDDDLYSKDMSVPISTFVETQDNELSIRNADNQEKTALNFCKLGLNISCIEPVDKTWNRVDLYEKASEVTSSTEINVLQITQVSDKLLPESENLTVLENVLRPESF